MIVRVTLIVLLIAAWAPLAAREPVANAAAPASNSTTNPTNSSTKPTLPPAPEGVTIEQNVTYLSPERKEKLDLYLPTDNKSNHPAIVIIHGGGWVSGDKANPREFNIGTTLALAGYVCASVNYQLDVAAGRWPTNLFDCKNAVRFLRKNADRYHVDADHIGVIGGSAGGHLALMVAYTTDVKDLEPEAPYPGVSDRVNAVIDMYGITNLLTRQNTDAQGNPTGERKATALLPTTPRTDEAAWKHASPVSHIAPNSPPTLILQGRADTTVDRDQSTELAAALKQAGVEHDLILFEEIGHTFDLQRWRGKPLPRDLRPVVAEFFDRHLRAKNRS